MRRALAWCLNGACLALILAGGCCAALALWISPREPEPPKPQPMSRADRLAAVSERVTASALAGMRSPGGRQ